MKTRMKTQRKENTKGQVAKTGPCDKPFKSSVDEIDCMEQSNRVKAPGTTREDVFFVLVARSQGLVPRTVHAENGNDNLVGKVPLTGPFNLFKPV